MPQSAVSAELVLSYLRADARTRAMYRTTMPTVFDDELAAAVDEADSAIAEAGDVAADALATGASVFDELTLPSDASGSAAAQNVDPAVLDERNPRVAARRMFEASLARLIAEQFDEAGDDDDAEELDAAMPETPAEKLFTVLPSVCELAGAESTVAVSQVCQLFHHAVVRGRESNAIWIGIAMREFGPEARAHASSGGADAMLSTNWRSFVVRQLAQRPSDQGS